MVRWFGGITMSSYRFYLKNRENVVIGTGAFDADDHGAAINFVRVRFSAWPPSCHSYELLQDDHVIHSENLPEFPEAETPD